MSSGSGGPYGNGFRNSHGNNPYGRNNNNYNLGHSGGWQSSQGPDYSGFSNIAGGAVGNYGGLSDVGGPVRLIHQYRWGPYGSGKLRFFMILSRKCSTFNRLTKTYLLIRTFTGGHGGAYRGRGYNS